MIDVSQEHQGAKMADDGRSGLRFRMDGWIPLREIEHESHET